MIYTKLIYNLKPSIVTIGNFDGVHTGHQYLLQHLKTFALSKHYIEYVITFLNRPKLKQKNFMYLTNHSHKLELLSYYGAKNIISLDLKKFIKHNTKDFINLLKKQLNMKLLIESEDFHMGKDQLHIEEIKKLYPNTIILKRLDDISSTHIRKLISEGNIKQANLNLGHLYTIRGKVIKGNGFARTKLNFPTINISTGKYQIPKFGVYKTTTTLDKKQFQSVTHVGPKPTFNSKQITIETHILNFNKSIYEQHVSINFIKFIREIKKFKTYKDLKKQIKEDIKMI